MRILAIIIIVALCPSTFSACLQNDPNLIASVIPPASPYQDINEIEDGKIMHLPTGIEVREEQLLELLEAARIIYVGEAHDSLADHQIQLAILKGLWRRFPGRVAVGMEMFRRPVQADLDRWVAGGMEDKEFQKTWYENWGIDDGYYKALLFFIRENKIPLIALNASRETESKIKTKGFKGLSTEDQKGMPEVDHDDPHHRKALMAVYKGHANDTAGFDIFYDRMLLWDETMAETVSEYLKSPGGADKKLIVFAGGFHVNYGFGIPRRVFRRLPVPYQIVLPHAKDTPTEKRMMEVTLPDLPLLLADYIWAVKYRELEDKKVVLGVQIESSQAGVRIISVSPESAADNAGITAGDIVVSFDGQEIKEPFDLTYAVNQKLPGDRIKVKIIRPGKEIEVEVVMRSSLNQ
ncbi:MAG TPA: ChaN family lipoprotein [Nitrospiria bacterium]|nr:ChaN family lipoprotein [Nitrospiria bacterium]